MNKLLIFILGLLVFLLLGYTCIYKQSAPAIEADLQSRASKSITRNNLSSVEINADGRDITLSGSVSSPELKAKAERVAAVEGYHLINNEIEIIKEEPTPEPIIIAPYSIVASVKSDQSVILSGAVPDIKAKEMLLDLAKSRYPNISNDISIKANAPSDWQPALLTAFAALSSLQQGQLEIADQKLTLSGIAESEEARQKIVEQLESSLPKSYEGNLDIALATKGSTVPNAENLPPVQQATQAAKNCQKKFQALLSKNKIKFTSGGFVLAKNSHTLLNRLAQTAKGCPNQTIIISGYTDSQGSEKSNRELSEKRAQAVADYLQKMGIEKEYLISKGYGEEKPIATNRTTKGRALNRRIELTVKGVK